MIIAGYSFATKKNLHVFCYRCSTVPPYFRRSEEPLARLRIAIIVLVPYLFRCRFWPKHLSQPWEWKTILSGSAIRPFHRMERRLLSAFEDTFSQCRQPAVWRFPLTAGPAHDSSPVWSPDGKLIAFASDRYGHYDVFVTSSQGGTARRLTTYSTDAVPTSFTPDGQYILFNAYRMGSAQSSLFPVKILPATLQGIDSGRTRTGDAFDHPGIACAV